MTVRQAMETSCDTGTVKGLSGQIIDAINLRSPGLILPVGASQVRAAARVNLYLQAAARQSLNSALKTAPQRTMTIISCYRTLPQQVLLYHWYRAGDCGIPLAARPGNSNHEDAAAIDIGSSAAWRPILKAHGWAWQGTKDPAHYSYRGAGFVGNVGELGVRGFQSLWNLHNPGRELAVDGDFGPRTEAAILASPADGWR